MLVGYGPEATNARTEERTDFVKIDFVEIESGIL